MKLQKKTIKISNEWDATFNSINDMVSIHDKDFNLVRVNKAFSDTFKKKSDELIGKKCFKEIHGSDEPCPKCPHRQTIKTGEPFTEEFFEPELGIYLQVSTSPVFDEKGRFMGSVHIAKDITERKQMEEELLRYRTLESVGILAGGIAHDFNNMLQNILGNISYARILSRPGSKIYSTLKRAENEYSCASSLTERLITFSKGGYPYKKTVYIGEFVKNTTDITLRGSNIKSEFKIPDKLWAVEADKMQLSRVIQNIVQNARDAMPEGGTIKVIAENTTISKKKKTILKIGEYIKISIEDNGIGIARKDLTKIFDPYFTTREMGNEKGLGLGLAVCYSIIKKHDGLITVESKRNAGTVFHIYLPASREKAVEKRIKKSAYNDKP